MLLNIASSGGSEIPLICHELKILYNVLFVIFVSTSVDSFCSHRITYMRIIIPVAKFIVLDWGDKVDSVMRLSHWPAGRSVQ